MIGVNNPVRKRELRIQHLSKLYVKGNDPIIMVRYAQEKYGVSFKLAKDYVRCAIRISIRTRLHYPNLMESHG